MVMMNQETFNWKEINKSFPNEIASNGCASLDYVILTIANKEAEQVVLKKVI
jgi:hypothetical protein